MQFHSKHVSVDADVENEKMASGVHSARIRLLGLSGYGDTEEKALNDCRRLFEKFSNAYHEQGRLEEALNRSGVSWQWAENS